MGKKNNKLTTNPATKPLPHRLEDAPSMDSRHGHGLSKDEALESKK